MPAQGEPESGRRRTRRRADLLLVERGLVESREQAQALIMAGAVFAPDGPVQKAGTFLVLDTPLEVRQQLPYVSRGGVKMAHALDTWADAYGISLDGVVALDAGASTGGFTDCLLQRGAARIYAVDVGYGQLHYRLRQDPRVVCMEKVNVRYPFELPEQVELLVADLSFISLTMALLEPLTHLRSGGYAVVLIKPQFEARRGEVGKGGIVRDDALRLDILSRVQRWLAAREGLALLDTIESPITGDAGNREFLALLRKL
ncbi:MAG: TlyA family RNA methyltransferase [Chloroflexi bacterium]|nr:TlyA family RNA methyltransferase [Chloroflexota bacterium]MYD48131.1 TlyA family RNA methyltransferase [Chloroflexota bacterium]